MSAFKDALALRDNDGPARLELAVSVLRSGDSAVMFEDEIAFWRDGDSLVAEVIDPYSNGPESPNRYQTLIESAKSRFHHSALREALGEAAINWVVVDDYGMGRVKLWPK